MQKRTDNISPEEDWACGDNCSSRKASTHTQVGREILDTTVTREESKPALGDDSIDWIKMSKEREFFAAKL